MKILIVPYYQVYPPKTGGSIAQFGTIEYLSQQCSISLLIPENYSLSRAELSELKERLPSTKIYSLEEDFISKNHLSIKKILGLREFQEIFSSLFRRIWQFTRQIFQDSPNNNKTVFKCINTEEEFEQVYSYNPYFLHSKKFVEKLNEIIRKDEIEIVQLEFSENLSLIEAIPTTVKKIFIEHECRFLRIQSHINVKQLNSPFVNYILNFNKDLELSLLRKADAILNFNSADSLVIQKSLGERGKKIEFATIPFPILDQDFRVIDRSNFELINKLVFIGGEEHFPNKDAIEWFVEYVAEDALLEFGLHLYVVGEWNQKTVRKYQTHPSQVYFTGFVKNLDEVLKNCICVVPVRIGAGLRTKILFAMAQGVPVISTSFAANGIHAEHLKHLMLADDKSSYIQSIGYLMKDPSHAFDLCQNAQILLKNNYSQSKVSQARYAFYKEIFNKTNSNFAFPSFDDSFEARGNIVS